MDNEKWISDGREWHEYPAGTKAKALMGGYWIKTDLGWHWPGGSTFPTPGGDASGEVCLPDPAPNTQLPAEVLKNIKYEANKIYWETHNASVDRDPYCRGLTMFEVAQIPLINALTEYATKLHQSNNEIEDKDNEIARLKTIVSKHKSGRTCQNQKSAIENMRHLLEKFISRHEGGLLPDRLLYNEIKTFLDGTK